MIDERKWADIFAGEVLNGLDKRRLMAVLVALMLESGDVEEVKKTIESWGDEAKEKWNNGTNYVESLNDADTRFINRMSKEIDDMIAAGVTLLEASEHLRAVYYSARTHDLSRILTTEATRVLAEQELKRGTKYIYHCVGDSRTCPECLMRDGQVFSAADAKIGDNLPPMHPWCRCWIEAWTN